MWNDFVNWLSSDQGERLLTGAIIPFVAIVVAGLVAALIARSAIKRLLAKHDRELKAAAIGALVNAARQASVWNSLSPQEQILADRAAGDADIQVRLLPIRGASVAAKWAAHEITEFKRGSATFGFQFDTLLAEFRDRLIDWQHHPARSRKIFQNDISRWEIELTDTEKQLQNQQDEWVAQQHADRYPSQANPSASTASASPARERASASPLTPAVARPTPNDADSSGGTMPVSPIPRSQPTQREVEAPDEDYPRPVSANAASRRTDDNPSSNQE